MSEEYKITDAEKIAPAATDKKKCTIATMCTWSGVSISEYRPPNGHSGAKGWWHVYGAPRRKRQNDIDVQHEMGH
ncbi:MAG: hypothetical protein ACRDRU_11715 [Pseudonocardiaceae bacterium]